MDVGTRGKTCILTFENVSHLISEKSSTKNITKTNPTETTVDLLILIID